MEIILLIMFIGGNLFLFSRESFDNLADNGFAWLSALVAIAIDIYFIYLIAQSILKRQKERRIIAENNRIADVTRKIEAIRQNYKLTSLTANRAVVSFSIDHVLINQEVVNSYKEHMAAIYERYSFIANEVNRILACIGCVSVDEKYSHLSSNEDKLEQLKEEGDSCLSQLSSYKIEILDDNCDILSEMKLAFRCLLNSKKCKSESLTIKEFLSPDKPNDLFFFKYEIDPIILFWEQYYFCLFSNVILVFDKTGVFATAIDPSALSVMVKRVKRSVTLIDGTIVWDQYIADDSKCVSRAVTRSTWQYTLLDGSPDPRYSYNPRLEYRTGTYEYVIVEFIIANKKVSFSASSGAVGDAFEKAIHSYSRRCNKRHNPIPEFLMLVKSLSNEDDAQIDSIIQTCNARPDANNYFCKIVAS